MASIYRDLATLLQDAGCRMLRQGKGSHEVWHSPTTGRIFTVPANITSRALANAIPKQAGLPKAF